MHFDLLTPAKAGQLILDNASLLPTEEIRLEDSLGRVLREDLHADRAFPPFDRVTMDGIAFRATDFSHSPLILQGLHPAGAPDPGPLKPGHCWQIMTGATLPADCDTVVPYEEIELTETSARITEDFETGQCIHRQGSDAAADTLLLKSGTHITPGHLGMMASIGAAQLSATRLPIIRILTTGDELIPVVETPLPHQLRQSNGCTLLAAVQRWGPAKASWTHLPDDFKATRDGIAAALEEADLVILSGGISKGKKDFVRPAIEELRSEPIFHGVAQRPGKPLGFWPGIAALPGNPNSTLTTFHRYLVPLLNKMTGAPAQSTMNLRLSEPLKRHPKLTMLLPVKLNSQGEALILSPQNSGDFITPLEATGYLEIPPGSDSATHGAYIPQC